jgi:hypothetical protein
MLGIIWEGRDRRYKIRDVLPPCLCFLGDRFLANDWPCYSFDLAQGKIECCEVKVADRPSLRAEEAGFAGIGGLHEAKLPNLISSTVGRGRHPATQRPGCALVKELSLADGHDGRSRAVSAGRLNPKQHGDHPLVTIFNRIATPVVKRGSSGHAVRRIRDDF